MEGQSERSRDRDPDRLDIARLMMTDRERRKKRSAAERESAMEGMSSRDGASSTPRSSSTSTPRRPSSSTSTPQREPIRAGLREIPSPSPRLADSKDLGGEDPSRRLLTRKPSYSSSRRPNDPIVPSLSPGLGDMSARLTPESTPNRPSTARRIVDLAPQRQTPPGTEAASSPIQGVVPLDGQAPRKVDEDKEREIQKRLQDKREKRRLLMEKESLGLARSKPEEASPVPIPVPAPAPAPVPASRPAPEPHRKAAPAKAAHADDGYEDDFETYSGDEFEADEEEVKAPSKQAAAPPVRSGGGAKASSRSSTTSRESAAAAPLKGKFTVLYGAGEDMASPLDARSSSVSTKLMSSLHPRAQRIKQLGQVIDLGQERFIVWDQAPINPFDMYQRKLRGIATAGGAAASSSGSGIRQIGCQTSEEDRTVETQTEEIERADKTMQFYLGDDTDFLEALKVASDISKGKRTEAPRAAANPEDAVGSSRLLTFLQRASQVCETLLEENLRKGRRDHGDEKDTAGDKDGSMFSGRGGWVEVYTGPSNKNEESKSSSSLGGGTIPRPWDLILRNRPVLDILFNPYPTQPHVLMTVHGPTLDGDKAPDQPGFIKGRSVIALWDSALVMVGRAMGPSKLLFGEGQFTCSCFGPGAGASLIVSGTSSGALHMWDLRERRDQHMPDFCVKNKITSGLRKPTYSTLGSAGVAGHVSAIVAVVTVALGADGENAGLTAFQLASLDDRGVLSLWLPTEVNRDLAGNDDPGLSLTGKIHLVRSRSVQVLSLSRAIATTKARGARNSRGGVGPLKEKVMNDVNWDVGVYEAQDMEAGPCVQCLAFSPSDLNHFFVGLSDGRVVHRSRFGEAKAPQTFVRADAPGRASATTIQFSPFFVKHFLVGYSDGVVALFVDSFGQSLLHWDTSLYGPTSTSSREEDGACSPEVTYLAWSPHRPSVIYVLLGQRGLLLVFDLLENDQEPILVEALEPTGSNGVPARISLSSERASHMAAGQVPCLAVAPEGGKGVKIRQLRKSLFECKPNEMKSFEAYLQRVL